MMRSVLPDRKVMYQAVMQKDSSFEGVFVTAVKTTGIFCRPGCTAKTPKEQNVEFYATAQEALSYGFRPCKVCRPMELSGESPDWIKEILQEIRTQPDIRLSDADLKQRGIEPERIRRWFKKHHGMTFQAYLRSLRINRAFGQIVHTEKVTDSAFESGYESLSGFHSAFKKMTGFTPSDSKTSNVITITRLLTPLGPMFAGATKDGICLLEFTDRRMLETQLTRLRKSLKIEIVPGENPHFHTLNQQLQEYFQENRTEFTVPLVLLGSEFQIHVWNALQGIPFGKTRSYQEQAVCIGNPKAVRAVAKANGDNKIAILIPCHRVIGKNGKLTGYGGGLWRKQYLLDLENQEKQATIPELLPQ